ncbi:MAG: hypothetical protein MI922_04150, partial [Bacteroidales bacterium]|nr:hypothetical protein [Bacteroidales bacterium]
MNKLSTFLTAFVAFFMLTSISAQYPDGLEELTSNLSTDASFELTTTDNRPGTYENNLVVVGDLIFFAAKTDAKGDELYVTDGTVEGTKLVKDINPDAANANPRQMTELGGKLYFRADNGKEGEELWVSDGTDAGTKMISDIYFGPSSSGPDLLTPFNGKLLFIAATLESSADEQKWLHIYDPVGDQVTKVADIQAKSGGDANLRKIQVSVSKNLAFFIGEPKGENNEIYVTDGTTAGTKKLFDVTPESLNASNIQWLYVANDTVAVWRQKTPRKYAGEDSANYTSHIHEQLWMSDGTTEGTKFFSHFNKAVAGDGEGTNTQFAWTYSFGDKLYFRADNGANGVELCVSDFTENGTKQLADYNASGASWPEDFAEYQGKFLFCAGDGGATGKEVRYLDGDEIKTFSESYIGGNGDARNLATLQIDGKDSVLFFAAKDANSGSGRQLFMTYGFGNTAQKVHTLHADGANVHNLTPTNEALYFTSEKVKKLFKYKFKLIPKIGAEGSSTFTVGNMTDTMEIVIKRINSTGFSVFKDVKVAIDSDKGYFLMSKNKYGPYSDVSFKTPSHLENDTVYLILDHSKLPDASFGIEAPIYFTNLETDTVEMTAKSYIEPVFRHNLVYHVDIGNDTTIIISSPYDKFGSNQSSFDQEYAADSVTGKKWGYMNFNWGDIRNDSKWKSMREMKPSLDEKGLRYKFEVDAGTYVVQMGHFEKWGSREFDILANGTKVIANWKTSGYSIKE